MIEGMSPEQREELLEELRADGYEGTLEDMYADELPDPYEGQEIPQIDVSHIPPQIKVSTFTDEDQVEGTDFETRELVYVILEDGSQGFITEDGYVLNPGEK